MSSEQGMELMLSLAMYCYVCWGARSLSSQIPTALLTTALTIWLNYVIFQKYDNYIIYFS